METRKLSKYFFSVGSATCRPAGQQIIFSWQYCIATGSILFTEMLRLLSKKIKSKNKKTIKTFFSVVSAAGKSKVSLSCSDDISKTTCTSISSMAQLFGVSTRNSCCYYKPGSSWCTTGVATNFSQLFQVWRSYSECLLRIAVAIPSRVRVSALLGLRQLCFLFQNSRNIFSLVCV